MAVRASVSGNFSGQSKPNKRRSLEFTLEGAMRKLLTFVAKKGLQAVA
jgi:hypothetical protein